MASIEIGLFANYQLQELVKREITDLRQFRARLPETDSVRSMLTDMIDRYTDTLDKFKDAAPR